MLYWPLRSPFSGLETVSRQCRKVLKEMGRLDTIELESGGPLNTGERLYPLSCGEVSRSLGSILCGAQEPSARGRPACY